MSEIFISRVLGLLEQYLKVFELILSIIDTSKNTGTTGIIQKSKT